ncbi:MAG: pentapeptide repeat-containing protein [Pirellulales bacterium]
MVKLLRLFSVGTSLVLMSLPAAAEADIFRWDNGQVIPGTEGIAPGPGVDLNSHSGEWSSPQRNLRFANFSGGLDLTQASFWRSWLDNSRFNGANLTNASLSQASLTNANLSGTNLTDAELLGTMVTGASFDETTWRGFTKEQLYSTASYQQKNLRGIGLSNNNLTGWDFSGLDLTGASFAASVLTNANLSGTDLTDAYLGGGGGETLVPSYLTNANLAGAIVTGARFFSASGFTSEQLYSTASYQEKDLRGIGLGNNDLTGWDFSGQDLTGADFWLSTLTNANLRGANLTSAYLWSSTLTNANLAGANLTSAALEATLTNANLAGANLTNASLAVAALTNANFAGAIITGANFYGTSGFTGEQLYSTASYQEKDLRGIGLGNNDLTGWDFSGQDLSHADLSGATLASSDLSGANLTHANITDSKFPNSDLTGADFRGASHSGLRLDGAVLSNTIAPDGRISGFKLTAGKKLVAYPGVPIPIKIIGDFPIHPTATFDLTDNAAIVDYEGTSTAAAIREHINAGRGGSGLGGDWTGTGITSSTAAAANGAQPDSRSLGYADNATLPLGAYTSFDGVAVDETSILIAFTRTGDANLDGVVNDDDVTIVGATYAPGVANAHWALGDFDYNGFVDDDDVTLLGAFYNPAAASLIAPTPLGVSSVAAVPEPSSLALLFACGIAGCALARRRILANRCRQVGQLDARCSEYALLEIAAHTNRNARADRLRNDA